MLNFVLPILKNPLTRMIGSKVIDGINHKMEKDKIIRAKEIEAVKTVSVEQVRQQEHSIKDEILTLLISAIFIFTFLPFSQPYMTKGFEIGEKIMYGKKKKTKYSKNKKQQSAIAMNKKKKLKVK